MPGGRLTLLVSLIAALLATPAFGPARAEGPGDIAIELNKVDDRGGDCRLHLVLSSGLAEDRPNFVLDLVLFDAEGTISRRLAVDLSPLPEGRTVVREVGLVGTACVDLGSVLINGVLNCEPPDAEAGTDCADAITATSRTGIALEK